MVKNLKLNKLIICKDIKVDFPLISTNPIKTSKTPDRSWEIMVKYLNLPTTGKSLSDKRPIKMNGSPIPKPNINSKAVPFNIVSDWLAQNKIVANIGPTHGVQANPKVIPNKKEFTSLNFVKLTGSFNLFSFNNTNGLINPRTNRPSIIMATPPIL